MAIDFNVSPEELEKARTELEKKKVSIPSGSLCRYLIYNIDFPKKVRDEAKQFRTKPNIMQGLDVKLAVLSYFDDKGHEHIVVDYSNPEDIQLPMGETGFRRGLYFRPCSKGSMNFHSFTTAENEKDAKLLFQLWAEKVMGIPGSVDKDTDKHGILWNGFWRIRITDEKIDGKLTGKTQFNVDIDTYDALNKKRLTEEEVNVELMDAKLVSAIWNCIEPDSFSPM